MSVSKSYDAIDSRAHWQRTEAQVFYTELVREILPLAESTINIPLLQRGTLDQNGNILPINRVGERVVQAWQSAVVETAWDSYGRVVAPALTVDSYESRIRDFTFAEGIPHTLQEGANTAAWFPFNLLTHAEKLRSERNLLPVYSSLGQIAAIYSSDWFSAVIHDAAFTNNGVWKHFSTRPETHRYSDFPSLDFGADSTGNTTFTFTEDQRKSLRHALRERNIRSHRDTHASAHNIANLFISGTSSGCPVMHHSPSFTNHPQDLERLDDLAQALRATKSELTAPSSLTAIDLSLQSVGSIFEKVADFASVFDREHALHEQSVCLSTKQTIIK